MIIFHEGLPRAGKTWEAMIEHALPALKSGRSVVTNIKGLNHAKIAEILGRDVEEIEKLLISVPWQDSKNIHAHAVNDGMVILDEVQDFFPEKCPLTPEQVEFITQHGQRGIDIVLCGQSYRNVHIFWRDRVQRLIYFKKLSMLGFPTRYQWTLNEKSSPTKFSKVQSGVKPYEKKYYGIYKAHVDGVKNKENLKDDRANIFKSATFLFWTPVIIIGVCVSIYFIKGLFSNPTSIVGGHAKSEQQSSPQTQQPANNVVVTTSNKVVASSGAAEMKVIKGQGVSENTAQQPADYVSDMLSKYRPRLAVLVKRKGEEDGLIELMDEAYHVREQFRLSGLKDFGFGYELRGDYVVVKRLDGKGGVHTVTPWPVDPWGRATTADPKGLQAAGASLGRSDAQASAQPQSPVVTMDSNTKYNGRI